MKKTIQILQRHIDESIQLRDLSREIHDLSIYNASDNCPMAAAAAEATGEECRVGLSTLNVGGKPLLLDSQVNQWRSDFDSNKTVFPFEFEIDY